MTNVDWAITIAHTSGSRGLPHAHDLSDCSIHYRMGHAVAGEGGQSQQKALESCGQCNRVDVCRQLAGTDATLNAGNESGTVAGTSLGQRRAYGQGLW